jgi:GTP diphosphokinase / guanosine-3',5'-bis(diphosphate) 3'-diphosphatase
MDDVLSEIIEEVRKYDQDADFRLIEKAFEYSRKAHQGQKRMSGLDYFEHPVDVVKILLELRPDVQTICAALLHDVVEETETPISEIEKEFGKEIASLVEGETKTTKVIFDSPEDYTAENWRKILLATTKDVRVILIKLADRLHNMRTLKYVREDKQKRISQETMDIYAPIAHKLGLYTIKGELEDLSLRYLKPDIYQYLKNKINEKRQIREEKAAMIIGVLKEKLLASGVEIFEISGRAKYFYSIYKKMVLEKKSFDELYDLIAVRIVVKTIPDCYRILAEIHQLWKPIPGRFKDYIAVPKLNGYQSLHTDMVTPYDVVAEVQIRTEDMNFQAKYGIAAHWRYKGTERDKQFDKRISWLEQVLDLKRKNTNEFLDALKVDLFEHEIVVFTPKGDPVILPEGSTPIDFAYEIHTKIGDNSSKAKVNKALVSLDYKLKTGDVIQILTSPNSKPSRNWLSFVVTSKAKQRIRASLGIEMDDSKPVKQEINETNLVKFIAFEGKKAPLKLSKCCRPEFEKPIVAYKTKEGTITVHSKDCPNIYSLDRTKEVKVRWDIPMNDVRTINVYVEDKLAMVEQILNTLIKEHVNVLSINLKPHKKSIMITLKIKAKDEKELDRAMEIIKKIKHVTYVNEESTR